MAKHDKPTKEERDMLDPGLGARQVAREAMQAMSRRDAAKTRLARRRPPLPPLREDEEEWDGKEVL